MKKLILRKLFFLRVPSNNFFYADALETLNHESKRKLQKALKSINVNSKPKSKTTARDDRIRNAMLAMTTNPPYSIERFLDEVATPDDGEKVFDIFGKDFLDTAIILSYLR